MVGTGLGSDIYTQTITKYCGINTGSCNGNIGYLGDWQLYGNCSISQFCGDNNPICQGCPDTDIDGICNEYDNCINTSNPNQSDLDNDTIGDVCDNCINITNIQQADLDNDGFGNVCDNCPGISNANQVDSNLDSIGDACTGTILINRSITLNEGWNLIGYPYEDKNVTTALSSIESCYKNIFSYSQGNWFGFNPLSPTNSLKNMLFGKGYWINVNCTQVDWTVS